MNETVMTSPEFLAFHEGFVTWVEDLRLRWIRENPIRSRELYELMNKQDRSEVHYTIAQWGKYITPLSEAWWKERGYGINWPDDDSKPMDYYKLEDTLTKTVP